MNQDTGKFRKNLKEQFYTNESVAKSCIQQILTILPFTSNYLWIEPSAGNGSFLHNIPTTFESIGLDIEPKAIDIQTQDFLCWNPPIENLKDIIVFGNPPFGRQSCFAKAFVKKSCEFAKVIAFILPKSFTKPSMFNVFHSTFHCVHSMDVGKDAFIIDGVKYHVPCVFQIWEKKEIDRPLESKIIPGRFKYVKPFEPYDIALRRVGGLAGRCYKKYTDKMKAEFNPQSHHFIRLDEGIVGYIDVIIDRINKHVFPSNTVGPRSLSKTELNSVFNTIIEEIVS